MSKSICTHLLQLLLLINLTACSSLLKKRTVAEFPSAPVNFYDSTNCRTDYCAEKKYDLANQIELEDFRKNIYQLIAISKENKNSEASSQDMDMLIQFHLGHSSISKGSKLVLDLIQNEDISLVSEQIAEVFTSMKNNFRPPLDTNFQLFYLPIEFFTKVKYNQIKDLDETKFLKDPAASSFWQPIPNSKLQNLYTGFNRKSKNNLSEIACEYDKPKSGFGIHPGFHIHCGDKKFKLKLGEEVHSAAFNARLYHALGYNVPVIDFIETPTINYNRRLLTEFNSRRIENFRIQLAGSTLFKKSNEHYFSPFDFIKEILLTDGTKISVSDFRKLLFKNSSLEKPELLPDNYNLEFENKISKIITVSASYLEKTDEVEIGPWRYDQLAHQERLELKGLQLLAAWVGNFDMRMDNTRLVHTQRNGRSAVKHLLSDVGSGLGQSNFLLSKKSSDIDKMPWTVTKIFAEHSPQESIERLEVIGLMNIETNQAFKKMTFADGQWIVEKLCHISNEQLKAALIASGLPSAEGRLAFEKLQHRRTQMVKDFKMESRLSECLAETNRNLNYRPDQNALLQALLPSGETVFAKPGNMQIKNGRLLPL